MMKYILGDEITKLKLKVKQLSTENNLSPVISNIFLQSDFLLMSGTSWLQSSFFPRSMANSYQILLVEDYDLNKGIELYCHTA
jgi:hypothetical protein